MVCCDRRRFVDDCGTLKSLMRVSVDFGDTSGLFGFETAVDNDFELEVNRKVDLFLKECLLAEFLVVVGEDENVEACLADWIERFGEVFIVWFLVVFAN